MATLALKCLTIPAVTKHSATVIFIHGLGDTGHGWEFLADLSKRDPALQHIKWVLPHAPIQPVTANGGMRMPTWFDITSFDMDADDEEGMLKTVQSIESLITAEVNAGVESRKIVLGGFSMGGAMTLLTGLQTDKRLGGLIVLSGWLPMRNKIKLSSHAQSLPIFWGHGTADPLVRLNWATRSKEFLTSNLGISLASTPEDVKGLSFRPYQGLEHSASNEELADVLKWLKKVFPA